MRLKHFMQDEATDGTASGVSAGGTGTAAPAAGTGAPAAFDWKTAGLDDASAAFVAEKQFKDMSTAIQSHRNLEKLVGVPADKLLRLPTDDSPEAWNAIYDKLGRPKDAAGYNLPLP